MEAEGICSFELRAVDGGLLPAFTAGSHIDVHLPNGLVRQYSLYNDPSEDHRYEIAVLHALDSRGGSSSMHRDVSLGDTLRISSPKNHFPLDESARESLLFAGGIGVTPILSMARRLYGVKRSFSLHYSARSLERMAFRECVSTSEFSRSVKLYFDNGNSNQAFRAADLLQTVKQGTHIYVCGPQGYMEHVLDTARELGWPDDQLHYEYFSAASQKQPSDGSFEVELASSGRTVLVRPEQSIVDALEVVGVIIPTSCKQGVCGTCLTQVLHGECDHRDLYLTPQERAANDQLLPCVSRALGQRIKLDL